VDFCKQTHTSKHPKGFGDDEIVIDENAQGVFWNFIAPEDEILDEYFQVHRLPRYENKLSPSDPNWEAEHQLLSSKSNFWYDWNVREWGTKWDITFDEHGENEIEFNTQDSTYYLQWYMETAWSPAVPIWYAMANKFPNLEFHWEVTEEANFYACTALFRDGKEIKHEWIDNPKAKDYEKLDIPVPEWMLEQEDEEVTA
jgi:hypothetical protein